MREDWLHFIIACLCHDIGYIKGVCRQDQTNARLYATGITDVMISLSPESTDASLTPFHVERSKLFVEENFSYHRRIKTEVLKRNIELTRFPIPSDEDYQDTLNYPGLVRAADFIGQFSDPRYLQKLSALWSEFEETGTNKTFGYRNPRDLQTTFPNFYSNVISPYLQPALSYLKLTRLGQQIVANLEANVLQAAQD